MFELPHDRERERERERERDISLLRDKSNRRHMNTKRNLEF